MNTSNLSIIIFFIINISCKANSGIIYGEWYNGYGSERNEIFLTGTLDNDELQGSHYRDVLLIISGNDSLKTNFYLRRKTGTTFKIKIDKFIYNDEKSGRNLEKELNDILKIVLPLKTQKDGIKIFTSEFKRIPSKYGFGIRAAANFSKYHKKDITYLFVDLDDIGNNRISTLSFNAVFSVPNLKTLRLINFKDHELPDRFDELKNLIELEIKNNGYTSSSRFIFPKQILKIPNLQKLKMQGVSTLSIEIEKLNKLELLEISYSTLGDIPKSLGYISNLKQLEISFSQISSFPSNIANLSKLEDLTLNANYKTRNRWNSESSLIPQEVWKLKELKYLNLGHIDKRSLPTYKVKLDSIQKITLNQAYSITRAELDNSYNEKFGDLIITEVPSFLFDFETLNQLIVYFEVSKVPKEVFKLKDVSIWLQIKSGIYTEAEKEVLKKRYEECCVKNKGKLIF